MTEERKVLAIKQSKIGPIDRSRGRSVNWNSRRFPIRLAGKQEEEKQFGREIRYSGGGEKKSAIKYSARVP